MPAGQLHLPQSGRDLTVPSGGLARQVAFALYETIDAVEQNARDERRSLTPEEEALIHALRVRTHKLFEDELRAKGLRGIPEES